MEELKDLHIAPDARQLVRAVAGEIARAAEAAVRESGRFTFVLSGGSTPADLYRLLADAREPFRARLPWPKIHLFWGDERHVPPGHAESNYRMARETLLAHVPVPEEHIRRIHAEDPDAGRAAAQYERTLRDLFPDGPRFDFVLMGLGSDAHTASWFPGNPTVHERERWVVAPWVEKHATFRITMTPPVINRAARIAFVVSGEGKAEAVRAVLEGERDVDRYPAQAARAEDGILTWWVDAAAAALLSRAR
jgi:6-phosphogluconolactonase